MTKKEKRPFAYLSIEIHRAAKVRAAQLGISLQDYVEGLIKQEQNFLSKEKENEKSN